MTAKESETERPPAPPAKDARAVRREERMARALRENLRRRKDQARQRQAPDVDVAETD